VRHYAEEAVFAGATTHFTHKVNVIHASDAEKIPCYRLLSPAGKILNPDDEPDVDDETLISWHKHMITLNTMDTILYDTQRQGRISFYMTSFGEEATHIGSAAAMTPDDIVYAQYREAGVLLHRGYTMKQMMDQCFGNNEGHGKGRQMPVHYGSKELNFHTISSPLGTQLPQATGAAYAIKDTGNAVICYFGDGSASEGDAHPAFNFAATLECPVLFFCRNNGYAISTPVHEQYRGDGIASRASGYGMDVIRVDGNDILGIYVATKRARELAVENNRPVLIEALTYRSSHHSTSDDSTAYRSDDEMAHGAQDSAIQRFHTYLVNKGIWDEDKERELQKSARKEVLTSFAAAEKVPLPSIKSMFDDVYDDVPAHLQAQWDDVEQHLAKYPGEYPVDGRASD
jgi:2-oxoisovalerate dehydrogenase E1 component alpha subunit